MTKKIEKRIVVKFYSNGKYLPSYNKTYYYDLMDDKSFNEAFANVGAMIHRICDNNKEISVRIETY